MLHYDRAASLHVLLVAGHRTLAAVIAAWKQLETDPRIPRMIG